MAEPSLTWDALAEMAARFDKPAAGCVLLDANMPSDLAATIPRSEDVVRAMYGFGHDGDDVWAIMQRLRPKDWAIVIPRSAEAVLLSQHHVDPSLSLLAPPDTFSGLPIYRVRSRAGAPWRDLLRLASDPLYAPKDI